MAIKEIGAALDRVARNTINDNFKSQDGRIDNLVLQAGDAHPELQDAHYSGVKGQTFATVGKRFDAVEQQAITDKTAANSELQAGLELKRDKSVMLTQADMSTASEAHKLTMNHLSQEVKNAITGTAPVSPNIANGQVATEKIADKAVTMSKLDNQTLNLLTKRNFLVTSGFFTAFLSNSGTLKIFNLKNIAVFKESNGASSIPVSCPENLTLGNQQCAYIDLAESRNDGFTAYTLKTSNMHSTAANGQGSFFADEKVILFSVSNSSVGGTLSPYLVMQLEFQPVFIKRTAGYATWDKQTNTLKWTCDISINNTKDRSYYWLSAGSIAIPGTQTVFVWLDTANMTKSTSEAIQPDQCIKVTSVNDVATGPFVEPGAILIGIFNREDGSFQKYNFLELEKEVNSEVPELIFRKIDDTNFSIFQKSKNGYVKYGIKRFTAPYTGNGGNADVWRVGSCEKTDSKLISLHPICTGGEWETAIKEPSLPDFMGGEIHGDEVLENFDIIIDGKAFSTLYSGEYICEKVTIKQKTKLFRCNTQEHVANNVKILEFTRKDIVLDQRVEWLKSLLLEKSFMAMLPILRTNGSIQITNKAFSDYDLITYDVSKAGHTDASTKRNGITEIVIFGEESGVYAKVELLVKEPKLPNSYAFVENTAQYNKLYFDFSGEYTTTVGEKWRQKTKYTINI